MLIQIPKMTLCEDVTRATFQILLKMLCLLAPLKRDVQFYFPRAELGSVRTLPGIVICEALPEICGVTDIALISMGQALNNISVKHGPHP